MPNRSTATAASKAQLEALRTQVAKARKDLAIIDAQLAGLATDLDTPGTAAGPALPGASALGAALHPPGALGSPPTGPSPPELLRLQSALQAASRQITTLSAVLKARHDAARSSIHNLRT